ncbi:MAG TPA: deoxyribodipyrimidine photo-lyase [Mycobacteriales bacterium]|nr:deoxyribodipyrimidine photo-lyase [Mycobacteriales bacterium]
MTSTNVLWFRRDLRLADNPALLAAAAGADEVLPLFVLDDRLRRPSGAPRVAFLYRCLRELDEATGGRLVVLRGRPENVLPRVARGAAATAVHVAADFGPYGTERDRRVADALDSTPLVTTGSPYAVAPGRVGKSDGSPFKVYSPFYRAWCRHGWRAPAGAARVRWSTAVQSTGIPADPPLPAGLTLPAAGERAAMQRWADFRSELAGYSDGRDRPDLPATSLMSAYLKFGCVHPRTLLADLSGPGAETYRKELAWREFYADVLWHNPESARDYYRAEFAKMRYDTDDTAFQAWSQGRTGYPIVDAGMRQLLAEGWMHNRVRMIVASFLVKDLHQEWTRGARWFLEHLVDGDLASNNHGWQWVAGCGTDAAPYFRIFNPVTQGRRFDPAGDYVRRYIPELAGISGADVHEPWTLPEPPTDYPDRIVEHARERRESLRRLAEIRS